MKHILLNTLLIMAPVFVMGTIAAMDTIVVHEDTKADNFTLLPDELKKAIMAAALKDEPLENLFHAVRCLCFVDKSRKALFNDMSFLNYLFSEATFLTSYTDLQKREIELYLEHIFSKESLGVQEKKFLRCLASKDTVHLFITSRLKHLLDAAYTNIGQDNAIVDFNECIRLLSLCIVVEGEHSTLTREDVRKLHVLLSKACSTTVYIEPITCRMVRLISGRTLGLGGILNDLIVTCHTFCRTAGLEPLSYNIIGKCISLLDGPSSLTLCESKKSTALLRAVIERVSLSDQEKELFRLAQEEHLTSNEIVPLLEFCDNHWLFDLLLFTALLHENNNFVLCLLKNSRVPTLPIITVNEIPIKLFLIKIVLSTTFAKYNCNIPIVQAVFTYCQQCLEATPLRASIDECNKGIRSMCLLYIHENALELMLSDKIFGVAVDESCQQWIRACFKKNEQDIRNFAPPMHLFFDVIFSMILRFIMIGDLGHLKILAENVDYNDIITKNKDRFIDEALKYHQSALVEYLKQL